MSNGFRKSAEICLMMMQAGMIEKEAPNVPGIDVSYDGKGAKVTDPKDLKTWRIWRYAARSCGWIDRDGVFVGNEFEPVFDHNMVARCYVSEVGGVKILRPSWAGFEYRRNPAAFLRLMDLVYDCHLGRGCASSVTFQEAADGMDFDDWVEFREIFAAEPNKHMRDIVATTDRLFPDIEDWREMARDPKCQLTNATGEDN